MGVKRRPFIHNQAYAAIKKGRHHEYFGVGSARDGA